MCSWKCEVITNGEGHWVSNRLRFRNTTEARNYVRDLAGRWSMVTDTRVTESDEAVNYRYIDGELLQVVPIIVSEDHTTGELA